MAKNNPIAPQSSPDPCGSGEDVGEDDETWASAAITAMPHALAVLNDSGRIVYVNKAWRDVAVANGGRADGCVGMNYLDVCANGPDRDSQEANRLLLRLTAGELRHAEMEYPCEGARERRWYLMEAWQFQDADGRRVAVMHIDITRRRDAELALQAQAERDPLTNLWNRRSFAQRVDHALARARRTGEPVAVLFADLNGFKAVNDTFGHRAGDHVLERVGERIATCVRETDAPARIGGDEFAILVEGADQDEADVLARRVKDVIAEPIGIDEHVFDLGCSIGVATTADGRTTVDTLLRDADLAMYADKTRR